ncbi:MAG: PAS domain-containing protein [Geobacter sp.]|nr:PAS domain-containing protein [Geobacter sp.]
MIKSLPKLHKKRFGFFTAIILLILMGSTVWQVVEVYQTTRESINKRQTVYATALAEHAERALGETLLVLERVYEHLEHPTSKPLTERQLYDLFIEHTQKAPQIASIFLVSQNGFLTANSLQFPIQRHDVTDRDYYRYHLQNSSRAPYFSRPYKNRIDNTWRFAVSRRITNPDGSFGGLVAVSLSIKYFESIYKEFKPMPTERISLTRKDGYFQMVVPFVDTAFSMDLKDFELFSIHLPKSLSGSFETRNYSYDGSKRMVAYQSLKNAPFIASVSIEPSAAFASWRKRATERILVSLIAGGTIIWLALRLLQQVRSSQQELETLVEKRTKDLSDTSHELARNEQRLQALLDISQYPATDVQGLLDYALQKVIEVTQSQIGYIYNYSEERQEFVLNTWSREVMPVCRVANPQSVYQLDKTGIWGEAVRQRKSIMVNDFDAPDPLKKGYPEGHVHLSRFLTVPIFDLKRKIIAVVGVANKEQPYTEQDMQQLELMMAEVWRITKRIELETRLIQAGREWQTTFDSIGDSVALLDLDQRVLRCNLACTRLFKRSFQEVIGSYCYKLLHGADRPVEDCPMVRARNSRKSESQLIIEKGRWLHVTVDPLLDEQGEVTGAVHIVRDDTERVNAEQSERELLAMLEAVQNELYVFSADSLKFKYVNQTAQHNLGYSLFQLLQMTPLDLKSGYSSQEFMALLTPLITGEKKLVQLETTHKRADGSYYPVEVFLQLMETRSGRRYLAVVHDISMRKQSEQQLLQALHQAENFRTALDFVNAYIYIKDLNSNYVYANLPTLKLFGCSAEELPGSPDSRFFPPEAIERLHEIDQRVFSGERTTEEVLIKQPDGTERVYLELKTPFYADQKSGVISGLLGISTDITEMKK